MAQAGVWYNWVQQSNETDHKQSRETHIQDRENIGQDHEQSSQSHTTLSDVHLGVDWIDCDHAVRYIF